VLDYLIHADDEPAGGREDFTSSKNKMVKYRQVVAMLREKLPTEAITDSRSGGHSPRARSRSRNEKRRDERSRERSSRDKG
jgi:hypothetical protein